MSGPGPHPAMLERLRAWAQTPGLMPDTATLQRRLDDVVDDAGGTEPDWQNLLELPCRVTPQQLMAFERPDPTEGKTVAAATWWIHLPAQTDVLAKDRILVGARTFEVTTSQSPHSFEVQTSVQAVELT